MRICLVSLDYKPYRSSGLTIYAEDLARGLTELGHTVTVLAVRRPGLPPHHWVGGVELHRVSINQLDELIGYLTKHRAEIPNYDQRRVNCQFNGAGMVEKENDLLVSRRQKRRGMQWLPNGADVICALRTLWFNGQWNAYWNTGLTCLCVLAG